MGDFPKGGLIGRTVHLWRWLRDLRIPLYAANASFFIILALLPALLLFLGLLRYTPLEVERLAELLSGILPEALLEGAEELILLTYDATSAYTLGLPSVTTLWSASRSVYGLLTGLNCIYGAEENRGWLRVRLVSMGYTFAFLLVLVLTLGLQVFGTGLLTLFLAGFWIHHCILGNRDNVILLSISLAMCMGIPILLQTAGFLLQVLTEKI